MQACLVCMHALVPLGNDCIAGAGQGGVINIWPLTSFETVTGIKGYTNKTELNWRWVGG